MDARIKTYVTYWLFDLQSFESFRYLLCCLLPIVLHYSLLFYRPLHFILTQLDTCRFTPFLCIFHFKTWPRHFAWFKINQWKLAIPRYGWHISTYKLSMTFPIFYHPSIYLIIIRRLRLPLSFYGHKLQKGRLFRCSTIGQMLQASSYKRDLYITPYLF